MQIARPVGRQAASRKYDLLTALGVHACHGDKHLQRLVLRFMTLIVARYNWQHDDLSVGQREIAALWAVDERTVKREMAKLRDKMRPVTAKYGVTVGQDLVKELQAEIDKVRSAAAAPAKKSGK